MAEAEVLSSKVARHEVDFAIITALEIEAKAVVSRLKDRTVKRFEDKDIRTYHCGTVPIPGTDQRYRVVVITLPSMGTISAANAVTDTIVHWNPRYVLMVGIAGGIPQDDLDLGDVVVAEQVVGYDYGKITDKGIKPRDRVYPASALLLDRVRNFWDDSWAEQVGVNRPVNAKRPRSKLFVGPVASGDKVIASIEFREQLLTHWPKLIAVEMESEGVFAAAFDRPQIPATLVIRGICDMADERKSDEWQEYAANAAAAFVVSFLKSVPVEPLRVLEIAEAQVDSHIRPVPLERAGSAKSTTGLSGDLYSRLRQTLLDCGPFESDLKLSAVFAHPSLKPWQPRLRQADSVEDRVDGLIDLLLNERNRDGESALILFLWVLSERIDPVIECHHRLSNLADDLNTLTISDSPNRS